MKGKASILPTLMFALLLAQPGFPESQSIQPNSDDAQLNAWFQLQQPEPWPETRPDPDPDQPPEQWPDQQPGHRTSADDQQESPMQTVIGTIVKEHGKYVLKAWDKKTYQIDGPPAEGGNFGSSKGWQGVFEATIIYPQSPETSSKD